MKPEDMTSDERRRRMTYLWQIERDYWCECHDCQQRIADAYMPLLMAEIAAEEEVKP